MTLSSARRLLLNLDYELVSYSLTMNVRVSPAE